MPIGSEWRSKPEGAWTSFILQVCGFSDNHSVPGSAGPRFGSDQNRTRKPNRKYLWSSTRPNGFVAVTCINPFRFFTEPSEFN